MIQTLLTYQTQTICRLSSRQNRASKFIFILHHNPVVLEHFHSLKLQTSKLNTREFILSKTINNQLSCMLPRFDQTKKQNATKNDLKYKSEEDQTKLVCYMMYILVCYGYVFVVKKPTKTNCKRMCVLPVSQIRDVLGNIIFDENITKECDFINLICSVKKQNLHKRTKAKFCRTTCAHFMTEKINEIGGYFVFGTQKKETEIETELGTLKLATFPKVDGLILNNYHYTRQEIMQIGENYYNELMNACDHLKKGDLFVVSNSSNASNSSSNVP